jgi:hypothetical protein
MFQIGETGLYVSELDEESKENDTGHMVLVKFILACIQMSDILMRFEVLTAVKKCQCVVFLGCNVMWNCR